MFGSKIGLEPQYNKEHNTTVSYDVKKLLSGYNYIFLKNFMNNYNRRGFLSRINLSIPFVIHKNNFKFVIIYGYDTFSSWLTLITCKILRKNVIWRGEAIKGRKNPKLKDMFKKIILKIFFLNCNYILYACKKNYEFLADYTDRSKLFSFPCSVDNNYFRESYNFLKHDRLEMKKKMMPTKRAPNSTDDIN